MDATVSDTTANRALPSDVSELQELVRQLQGQLNRRDEQLLDLVHRMNQLLRGKFGKKAETFDPAQLVLFAELAALEPLEQAVSAATEEDTSSKKAGHARRKPAEELPRLRREYTIDAEKLGCPECGELRTKCGEEVTEQYDYVPASIRVVEHARFKYACKPCQGYVVLADAAQKPVEKGMATTGMLAHIATSKFADHLPLHRQETILKRHGAKIARSTMCDWIAQTASILEPLYERMKERVLSSRVIWTDDTPVKMQDRVSDKNVREARIWVYLGDVNNSFTVFDFTESRRRDGPLNFVGDWNGFLQADAFAGYDCIFASGNVLEVACMAHARRKFFDCLSSDKKSAGEVLAIIHKLYAVEREAKTLSFEDRRALRLEKSAPLLRTMHAWLTARKLVALPKSPLGKAITYALNNWRALCRYLVDGELSIDNNASENALRPVAIGRKNWLFAGSREGGRNGAIISSFIRSCKQHGVNPQIYLTDVLTRLVAGDVDELDRLLPGSWVPAA